jgi:hypothetical protein
VLDEFDDPNPPEPTSGTFDSVRARARQLRRRKHSVSLAMIGLLSISAFGLVRAQQGDGQTTRAVTGAASSTVLSTSAPPSTRPNAIDGKPATTTSLAPTTTMKARSTATSSPAQGDVPTCAKADLAFGVTTDARAYARGQNVHITVTYRNISSRTCSPNLCGQLWVADSTGAAVWKPLTACASVRSYLQAGELQSYSSEWDQACDQPSAVTAQGPCPDGQASQGSYSAVQDWDAYGRTMSGLFTLA